MFFVLVLLFGLFQASASCVIKEVSLEGLWQEDHQHLYASLVEKPCSILASINQEVLKWHEDHGFPAAQIQVDSSLVGFTRVILDRGTAWVWASPENKSQSKTKKDLWPKLSGIKEGAPFSLSHLGKAETQLLRLGYYEKEAPTQLFRQARRYRLVPVFFMKDRAINHAEAFFSYSSVDKEYSGSLEIALLNIMGTARDLYIEGETGEWGRSLSIKYKEPWIFSTEWSGLLRGAIEEDSLSKDALLEIGLSRMIFWDIDFAFFGGIGDDEWTTALELRYLKLDRFILPRSGISMDGGMKILQKRDSVQNATMALQAEGYYLLPFFGNGVLRFSISSGALLPVKRDFAIENLFELGGVESFKGYRKGFFRSRAYGWSECLFEWQTVSETAFQIFYQPGIYKARSPEHGWKDVYSYGLGLSQYRDRWNISIYYALHSAAPFLEGLLHLNVKTVF